MRINQVSNLSKGTNALSPVEEKSAGGNAGHGFRRHMSDVNTAEYEKYLKDLTDRIQMQGELVSKKMDLAEFQKYRAMITELLNETASNSYMYYRSDKFDARGRHKVVAVIRRVNQRLDELAESILRQETENINSLSVFDDIRGMLVDLFL